MAARRSLNQLRWWWMDRRRIVALPNGYQPQSAVGAVTFVSPPVVAIEAVHDPRASAMQIEQGAIGHARRVRSLRRKVALYRLDEPVADRSASGHWVTTIPPSKKMVLRAIALVPQPGFPIRGL